jgi:hypothetical protein
MEKKFFSNTRGVILNRMNIHCTNILFSELKENDMTYKEMVSISGFSIRWIIKLIKNLENKKKVHVCGYYKDSVGREKIKIWRWGRGKNLVPNKLSGAERQKMYLARMKIKQIPISLIC